MEKRAVVTKYTTPDLERGLRKNASSVGDFMDRMMKPATIASLNASREDERTFEDEAAKGPSEAR